MKTPLFLLKLAALVWLLVPASASAFYNPQAGRWLNRDPIEESAFAEFLTLEKPAQQMPAQAKDGLFPLYAFNYNQPISLVDPEGLSPAQVVLKAYLACMFPHFIIGMNKYPKDEAMRHCWTSCAAARTCGAAISAVAGLGFEVVNEGFRALMPGMQADWANALYDLSNNAVGLRCAGWESFVTGPLVSNVTRWCRTSCDDCCRASLK
jgi:hypothetical protein